MSGLGVGGVIYGLALVAFLVGLVLHLAGRPGLHVAQTIGFCLLTLGHMI